MSMPVTLEHVAKAASVSTPTVSLILNGKGQRYKLETRERVLAAAQKLNYRPNISAQSLRQQRSFLIGALMSQVNASIVGAYYEGIQIAAAQHNCAPITFTCGSPQSEAQALQICVDRRVDALIVNNAPRTSSPENLQQLSELAHAGMPMVEVFGRNISGVPSIESDFEEAGYQSTKMMTDLGLTRILYWSPIPLDQQTTITPRNWYILKMYRGYQRAIAQAGLNEWTLPFVVNASPSDDPEPESVRLRSFTEQATAILTQNDPPQAIVSPYSMTANAISLAILKRPEIMPDGFTQTAFDFGPRVLNFRERRIRLEHRVAEIGNTAATRILSQLRGQPAQDLALCPIIELLDPNANP